MPLVGQERGIRTANEQIQCQTKRAQNASDMFEKKGLKLAEGAKENDASPAPANRATSIRCRTIQTKQKTTKHKLL